MGHSGLRHRTVGFTAMELGRGTMMFISTERVHLGRRERFWELGPGSLTWHWSRHVNCRTRMRLLVVILSLRCCLYFGATIESLGIQRSLRQSSAGSYAQRAGFMS